jgi:hypothetical protein
MARLEDGYSIGNDFEKGDISFGYSVSLSSIVSRIRRDRLYSDCIVFEDITSILGIYLTKVGKITGN